MELSESIGYGSVKYADLKQNKTADYVFSFDRMLDPRGNTAVYLLYAYARVCSIMRKALPEAHTWSKDDSHMSVAEYNDTFWAAQTKATTALRESGLRLQLDHPCERTLAVHLLRFHEVVREVSTSFSIHHLCEYMYRLSEL